MRQKRLTKLCGLMFSIVLLTALFLVEQPISTGVQAFSGGPDLGRTGAPGELTCATGECHGTQRSTDPARFRVLAPATYQPGVTYPIMVEHNSPDPSRLRWGFQLTALTKANTRAGTWHSTDAHTQVVEESLLQRQYAQHTLAGTFAGQSNGASWTLHWTAPSANLGPITFYAAGNQADFNHNSSGDRIFLTQATMAASPPPTPTPTPTPLAAPAAGRGSLLFFNFFTSSASQRTAQDTRVSFTNTHETQAVVLRFSLWTARMAQCRIISYA